MTLNGKIRASVLIILSVSVLFGIFSVASKGLMKLVYPIKYSEYVEKYSAEFGVDKNLLYTVIKTESSFNPDAVSDADAVGLTQITPETLDWIQWKLGEDNIKADLHDPETSIRYGAFLLGYLVEEFGNTDVAAAAYHAGMNRVKGWLKDEYLSPDGKTLSEIPIPETAHYVRKINKALNVYNNLYTKGK